jgi:hypothetical protein
MSTPVVDVSPASNPGLTDKPDEVTKSYIMQQAVSFSLSLSQSPLVVSMLLHLSLSLCLCLCSFGSALQGRDCVIHPETG